MKREICVRFKGSFYSFNTHCSTLKEFCALFNHRRSSIAEWWYA